MAKHAAPPRRRHSAQKHASHKGVTLYTLGVLLVAVSVLLSLRFWPRRIVDAVPPAAEVESPAVSEELAVPEPQPVVTTLRFSATGDNLIHKPIYSQAARRAAEGEGYSFDYCYRNLLDFYAQQDINWINQETLCSKELAPSTYPCFSTPGECAEALYRAGFRVFSLSNNHTYDKGAAGIAATLRFWETMPEDVITTGLWKGEADYGRIPIQTVDGVKIAYLSYTEHTNGIPRNSKMTANIIYTSQQDVMEQQVRAARQEADFVVVGVHWGVEDSHNITQAQRTLAQSLADWGADVIIGTHPHVLQDAEWRTAADGRNVFVAYSLGNFLSTQSKPDQLIGAVLTLDLEQTTEPDGSVHCAVRGPKLHVTVTHYDAGKSNVRTYLFRDYTPELAQAHGVRAAYPSFGYDYIRQTAQTYINSEFWSLRKACIRTPDGQNGVFTMYGVSKINIEPSLMMISVQDAEFKGNTMARYLQIFADTGVVVDMISQSAPHGTSMDFSFTAYSSDLPLVMKAISAANLDKDAKASPLISVGYSKLNLFGEEMVTSCGVAARALNALAMAGIEVLLITTSDLDISLLVRSENEDAAYETLKKAYEL